MSRIMTFKGPDTLCQRKHESPIRQYDSFIPISMKAILHSNLTKFAYMISNKNRTYINKMFKIQAEHLKFSIFLIKILCLLNLSLSS